MLLGLAAPPGPATPAQVRRVIVGRQIILRVPVRPLPPPRFEWEEHKGPKCIAVDAIRGAMLSGPATVDFQLPDRQRVRADFAEDCPALDFYGGFYLKPEDDRVCADRDSIHSRIGGSCRIERFHRLVPKIRR